MELEHTIMCRVMRIASQSRRKPLHPPHGDPAKCHGFGHILDLLAENDGLRQQQIAELLHIRPQSASEAVANMEQAGLVRREPDEQDRRSSRVCITPEGKQQQTESLNRRIQNAKRIMAPLDEDEKETLLRLLDKIAEALQENKEEN